MSPHSHTLIWRDSPDGAPSGAAGLLNWIAWDRSGQGFRRRYGVGQVGDLVAVATSQAIERSRNVSVAWGSANPATTPANELEPVFRKLRPAVIVLPERPGKTDRWAISSLGTPASLPAAAIQQAVSDQVATLFPRWQHGASWNATAFLLRHDVSAEELGLIEPKKSTPDDIVNLVSSDPDVLEATRRADRSLPGTFGHLIHSRFEAQRRAGIAPADMAPIYSGEVETYLVPLVAGIVSRGDVPKLVKDGRAAGSGHSAGRAERLVDPRPATPSGKFKLIPSHPLLFRFGRNFSRRRSRVGTAAYV